MLAAVATLTEEVRQSQLETQPPQNVPEESEPTQPAEPNQQSDATEESEHRG